ncbi:MAG: radical SAM protein [candidate division WOR-3 bacterium]
MNKKYIFGPVPSRRLGYSLGIDLVEKKYCTYDCIYCEVGKTTNNIVERIDFHNDELIVSQIEKFLKDYTGRIDCITFTGSGEPTLNIKMGKILNEVKKITTLPITLLTNGSLFFREDVRIESMGFDIVIPSLDSVSEESFVKVNQPNKELKLSNIIEGLIKFSKDYRGKIFLEILLVKGVNDSDNDLIGLRKVIEKMRVDKIQINTVVRPPAYSEAKPIGEDDKERIKNLLGDFVQLDLIFSGKDMNNKTNVGKDEVKELLKRRPCTFDQISVSLGIDSERLKIIIEELERDLKDKLKIDKFDGEFYYKVLENE